MIDFLQAFWTWVNANPGVASAVFGFLALILAVLAYVFGFFGWMLRKLLGKRREPPHVVVQQPGPMQPGSSGTITLTVEAYEERLQQRADEIAEQIRTATGAERERLVAEKSELEERLADIDSAYAEAKARIVELEEILARFGNEIGGDRLAEARAALEAGDFSKADEIFAEVQAREEIAVQRATEAAFGQGRIAEEQVRRLDAAEYYAKAARLAPNYDRLIKAGNLLSRAGRLNEAIRFHEELVTFSNREFGEDDEKTAIALNNLAASYRAMGRHAEAEPLYRQAIATTKAALGEAHPNYAGGLNNLASLLEATGRHAEAEPLYRQALATTKAALGDAHPAYATRLNNLAALLQDTGRHAETAPLYRQALEILRDGFGDEHPSTRTVAANYAGFLRQHFPDDPALARLAAAFGEDFGR